MVLSFPETHSVTILVHHELATSMYTHTPLSNNNLI